METKKMTLKEAQEFVKNTKYIVWSEDESRKLQKKLFEIGCGWLHSGKGICHEEHPFLTVDESLHIRYREKQYYTYFEENKNRYIETYHILNMELEQKQPKPKFDPTTLQPFDKVLVRDEAITEERQEVEQLNQNGMEITIMTKSQAQEYVNNTKIICTSIEETKKLQKKLFDIGIKWNGEQADDVNDDAFLLFIDDYKIFFDGDISYWMTNENRRIEPSEILAIEIEQPKPKFDPNTLQLFDKVLVRNEKSSAWRARFFEVYKDGVYYVTSEGCWKYCIPYNDETKHLHGTHDEAPEFYKLD